MRVASAPSTLSPTGAHQQRTSISRDDTAINAICTFVCMTIALVVAIAHTLARLGFEDLQILSAIKGLVVLAAVVGFPSLVRRAVSVPAEADGLLICGALGLLIVFSAMLPYPFGFALACIVGIAGTLCTVTELPSLSKKQRVTLAVATTILSVWAAGYLYAQSVHDPLVLEMRMAHGGRSDSIFHSALVENLKTHGIISTGVDGIQVLNYHTASHRLFAYLSDLTGETALDFYLALYLVVIPPLFIRALFLAVSNCRAVLTSAWTLEQFTSPKFWLFTLVMIVGCIPDFIRHNAAGLAWGQPFASESYTTSLTFFFLGLSVVAFLGKGSKLSQWIAVSFTAGWVMLLTASKVPWLVIAPLAMGFLFIREQRFRNLPFASAIVLASAGAYLVNSYSRASECQGGLKFSAWDWFKYTDLPGHDAEFMLLYFLPVATVVVLSLIVYGFRKSISLSAKETVLPQLVLSLSIVTFAFINVIELKAAAGLYFIDPIRWMTLLTLMILWSSDWFSGWKNSVRKSVAISTLALLLFNAAFEFGKAIDRNLRDRRQLAAFSIAHNESYQFIQRLQELHSLPVGDRRQTLLFIPQSCSTFWTMCHDRYGSFMPQALSGIAMLDGVLPASINEEAFGFASYRKRVEGEQQATDAISLTQRAKQMGFERVITLDWVNGAIRERLFVSP